VTFCDNLALPAALADVLGVIDQERPLADSVPVTTACGFVDTPMTAHLPRSPLFASPDNVARGIVNGMDKGKSTIYVPFFWKPIMLIIRLLPEPVFNRLSI